MKRKESLGLMTEVEPANASSTLSSSPSSPRSSSGSSSSSSSGVSTTVVLSGGHRRSTSDLDKQTLEGLGIINKDMQKTFLSLRVKDRKVRIGLSCVGIADQQAMKNKCDDIISAVTTMESSRQLEVLLPVHVMVRHGLTSNKSSEDLIINERLDAWAAVLGLAPKSLYPLVSSDEILVQKPNYSMLVKSWKSGSTYLPKTLEDRIDKLVQAIKEILEAQLGVLSVVKRPLIILERDETRLKPLLKEVLTASLREAGVNMLPDEATFENILNGVIFHTLLAIAHRHPELKQHLELLSPTSKDKEANKAPNLAVIGTEMMQTLVNKSSVSEVGDEFAHGIAYLMEEMSSPEIIKQSKSGKDVLIYISVKDPVRCNNPLRLLSEWLNPTKSLPAIEPCNAYVTREKREEKLLNERADAQTKKTPSPEDEELRLQLASIMIAQAAKRGWLSNKTDGKIDGNKVNIMLDNLDHSLSDLDYDSSSSKQSSRDHSPAGTGSRVEDDKKKLSVARK
jgi:hypothetical protein